MKKQRSPRSTKPRLSPNMLEALPELRTFIANVRKINEDERMFMAPDSEAMCEVLEELVRIGVVVAIDATPTSLRCYFVPPDASGRLTAIAECSL